MKEFLMIDIGAALLLFGSVPLAHWVLRADARLARHKVAVAARKAEQAEAARVAAEAERRAEEARQRRIMEEAQQMVIWAKHAPYRDKDGNRWGRTLSAPPPWK